MNSIETLRRESETSLKRWMGNEPAASVRLCALRKVLAFVEAYAASGNAPKLPKSLRALFEEMMKDE